MSTSFRMCSGAFVLALGWNVQAAWLQDTRPVQVHAQTLNSQAVSSQVPTPTSSVSADVSNPRPMLDRYCATCHNARLKTAGLSLDGMGIEHVGADAEAWEKVVRKLRSGAMPPAGRPPAGQGDLRSRDLLAGSGARPVRLLRTPILAGPRSIASTGPSMPTSFATCSRWKSMQGRCCRPTMRIWASTTWRTSFRSRPCCSSDPCRRRGRSAASQWAIPRSSRPPRPTSSPERGFKTTAWTRTCRSGRAAASRFATIFQPTASTSQDPAAAEAVRLHSRPSKTAAARGPCGWRARQGVHGRRRAGDAASESYAGRHITDREWEDYTQHADEGLEVRFRAKAGPRVVGVSFVQGRSERDGVLQPRRDRQVPRCHRNVELTVRGAGSCRRACHHRWSLQRHRARRTLRAARRSSCAGPPALRTRSRARRRFFPRSRVVPFAGR